LPPTIRSNISHFTYDYNLANQLTASTNVLTDQTTGYKYDLAGRLTAYGAVSQFPNYTDVTLGWDAENRLTSYSANGQTTTYAYNGYGDRYSQQVDNGAPTFYTLDYNTDLTQVLAATTNSQTTNYLTGIGEQSSNNAWSYYNTDGLGSVRQMTDASGAITYAASYEPYGTPFEQWPNPQTASAFGYTGESTDANSLVYLRARYYDPRLGVFLSKDPFEGVLTSALSQNGYSYAHGNPVRYTDPSGHCIGLAAGLDTAICIGVVVIGSAFVLGMLGGSANAGYYTLNNWDTWSWGGYWNAWREGFTGGAVAGALLGGGAILSPGTAVTGFAIGGLYGFDRWGLAKLGWGPAALLPGHAVFPDALGTKDREFLGGRRGGMR
jgi:RHS repeat-associated protein